MCRHELLKRERSRRGKPRPDGGSIFRTEEACDRTTGHLFRVVSEYPGYGRTDVGDDPSLIDIPDNIVDLLHQCAEEQFALRECLKRAVVLGDVLEEECYSRGPVIEDHRNDLEPEIMVFHPPADFKLLDILLACDPLADLCPDQGVIKDAQRRRGEAFPDDLLGIGPAITADRVIDLYHVQVTVQHRHEIRRKIQHCGDGNTPGGIIDLRPAIGAHLCLAGDPQHIEVACRGIAVHPEMCSNIGNRHSFRVFPEENKDPFHLIRELHHKVFT